MTGRILNHKLRITLIAMLLFIFSALPAVATENRAEPKVIVLVLDNLGLADLQHSDLSNFRMLLNSGGLGLMNTRTHSLTSANRASAYLTIGMGVRTSIPDYGKQSKNGQALDSLYRVKLADMKKIKTVIERKYPNYTLGKIGDTAKKLGFKVAVVGNADTNEPVRYITLMATDSDGNIPTGNVEENLTIYDPDFIRGHRTNMDQLLRSSMDALVHSDILFIDFGDTARINEAQQKMELKSYTARQMKHAALKRADGFIGNLLKGVEGQDVTLMVVSPSPSYNDILRGNKTLAPIIIYEKDGLGGILTSNTTKRRGLIANIDIGPTIFQQMEIKDKSLDFIGEEIYVLPDKSNLASVTENLSRYTYLKRSRYIIHALYATILALALSALYWPVLKGRKLFSDRIGRGLAVAVLTVPAASLIIPTIMKSQFYYLDLLLIVGSIIASAVIFSGARAKTLLGMGIISLVTATFIITVLFWNRDILLNTPLGFDDVFMGGRYYGINNDCMGILLGSTIFSLFYFLNRFKIPKFMRISVGMVVVLLMFVSHTPSYGANVGGTIAAMTTGVIALMGLVSNRPLKFNKVVITVLLVFLVELGIAYFDSLINGGTHAGKVMKSLLSQSFGPKFLEILQSKLSLFGLMLLIPPWNLFLGVQLYIYFMVKKRSGQVLAMLEGQSFLVFISFKVILYGGLVAFVFNDTGVIATALMLTYLSLPLGVLINDLKNLNE